MIEKINHIRRGTKVPGSKLKSAKAGCFKPSLDGFHSEPGDESPGVRYAVPILVKCQVA